MANVITSARPGLLSAFISLQVTFVYKFEQDDDNNKSSRQFEEYSSISETQIIVPNKNVLFSNLQDNFAIVQIYAKADRVSLFMQSEMNNLINAKNAFAAKII